MVTLVCYCGATVCFCWLCISYSQLLSLIDPVHTHYTPAPCVTMESHYMTYKQLVIEVTWH